MTEASIADRARGARHVRALRDVAWACGKALVEIPGAMEASNGVHFFDTRDAANAARLRCEAITVVAPIPPRWRLDVRSYGGIWGVSLYNEEGAPVAQV